MPNDSFLLKRLHHIANGDRIVSTISKREMGKATIDTVFSSFYITHTESDSSISQTSSTNLPLIMNDGSYFTIAPTEVDGKVIYKPKLANTFNAHIDFLIEENITPTLAANLDAITTIPPQCAKQLLCVSEDRRQIYLYTFNVTSEKSNNYIEEKFNLLRYWDNRDYKHHTGATLLSLEQENIQIIALATSKGCKAQYIAFATSNNEIVIGSIAKNQYKHLHTVTVTRALENPSNTINLFFTSNAQLIIHYPDLQKLQFIFCELYFSLQTISCEAMDNISLSNNYLIGLKKSTEINTEIKQIHCYEIPSLTYHPIQLNDPITNAVMDDKNEVYAVRKSSLAKEIQFKRATKEGVLYETLGTIKALIEKTEEHNYEAKLQEENSKLHPLLRKIRKINAFFKPRQSSTTTAIVTKKSTYEI